MRVVDRLDMHRTICAAIAVGTLACTGLDFLKDGSESPVVPPLVAGIRPLIEVSRMSPNPYHGIDAAGSADDLSSRPVELTPRGSCLRRRAIGPIDIGSKIGGPKHWALQSGTIDVSATRLDQQDAAGRIF